jgi:hypothetical protein
VPDLDELFEYGLTRQFNGSAALLDDHARTPS